MSSQLWVTGDIMIEQPVPQTHPGFARLRGFLATGDEVFVNVEIPLTDTLSPADKLVRFRAAPGLAAELAGWGATVGTVANNHAFDHGPKGLFDTLQALRDNTIAPVGGGTDLAAAFTPHLTTTPDGLRLALIGMACTLPGASAAGPDRPGIAAVRVLSRFVVDPAAVEEQPGISPLVETRAMADAVVVAIHWGIPRGWVAPCQGELADYQPALGHALIDAGADAVIGHHPHVLHGIELHRGRPIAYSLGNFLFHAMSAGKPPMGRPEPDYSWRSLRGTENRYGGIVRLGWPDRSLELLLVLLDGDGVPAPADGADADAEHAFDRVEQLSAQFIGTSFTRTRWCGTPVLRVEGR